MNNTTNDNAPSFETACADMDEAEVQLLMAECANFTPMSREPPPSHFTPTSLDAIEKGIIEGKISPAARLPNILPILAGKRPNEWYAVISESDFGASFKKDNPKLWDALYTISDEDINEIFCTIRNCPGDTTELNLELERINARVHHFEVSTLAKLYGIDTSGLTRLS